MREIKKDWRDIFRAFRMALDPKKLTLGLGGVVSSIILIVIVTGIFKYLGLINLGPKAVIKWALFSSYLCPYELLLTFFKSMMTFSIGKLAASILLLLGLLAIWSLVGGAITRIAALEYAKDESIRLVESLRFSSKKFWSYFWSPLVPAIGVIFFALCNVLGGLIGKLGILGNLFVGIGFPLALLSSFMIAFVGIVGIIGLCLMFPTISAEGSDAFDAMSRAYSYVLSKPRKFFAYFFTSSFYGIFCIVFIGLVACLVINITFDTVGIGMGQKFKDIKDAVKVTPGYGSILGSTTPGDVKAGLAELNHWSLKFAAIMMIFYLLIIKTIIYGFVASFYGSAKTIVYFLLRKDVDETEISDVYIEKKDVEEVDKENTSEDKEKGNEEEIEETGDIKGTNNVEGNKETEQ